MNSTISDYFARTIESINAKGVLTPAVFNSLINPLTFLHVRNNTIFISSPSSAHRDIVNSKHLALLEDEFAVHAGQRYSINIISQNDTMTEVETEENPNTINDFTESYSAERLKKSGISTKFVFDNFIKGNCNQLAYSAAIAASEAPGTIHNPLFLYGGVGLGKTHLMHSIGNSILDKNPNAKVLYCTSEDFTNELINSIRNKQNQEFRDKYRLIDVLLIDDIQFLAEKEGTQEEFFHTFNALYNNSKQIVITSDQHPSKLKTLMERLTSRFNQGITADLKSPDFETRSAILQKKAEINNVSIADAVTQYIAKIVDSNIRELEGALNTAASYAKLLGTPVSRDVVDHTLKSFISDSHASELSVSLIIDVVSTYYNVDIQDLLSSKRSANIIKPRQVAMYLTRELLDISFPAIAKEFKKGNHTSVLHNYNKVIAAMESDVQFAQEIHELEEKLKLGSV